MPLLEETRPDLTLEEADWGPLDEKRHPRWPKGTPGGLGGQFMKVGQLFEAVGKVWEVVNLTRGHVFAQEASGKVDKEEHRDFPVTLDPDGEKSTFDEAKAAPVKFVKGGGKYEWNSGGYDSNVTLVSPLTDSTTHNPELKPPPGVQMTDEEWQRFGEVEQRHFIDLQERFGTYDTSKPSHLIKEAYNLFDATIQNIVDTGFNKQYGSSSGYSLSLASLFEDMDPEATDEHSVGMIAATAEERQKARELQGLIGDVYAWDLYNRTRSPDVTVFHGTPQTDWTDWLQGKNPVFSGLSMTWNYDKSWAGHKLAFPLSIRYVVMNSEASGPLKGAHDHDHSGEQEIAMPFQMKLSPDKAIAFSEGALDKQVRQWLTSVTQQPVGGAIIEQFIAYSNGEGDLPLPPPPADITIMGGNASYLPPPDEALTAMEPFAKHLPEIGPVYEPEQLPNELPWDNIDSSDNPVASIASQSSFEPGDYMMGLKGTLYWVGPSPESDFPFRYWKIIPKKDENGNVTGLEWTGESFEFEGAGGNKYYKLNMNVAPATPDKMEKFDPEAWVLSQQDPTPVKDLPVGSVFKVNGSPYEITDTSTGTQPVKIKDLTTGFSGTINGGYPTVPLDPYNGGPTANGKLIEKGMVMPLDGVKATVTSVSGDTISVKPHKAKSKVVKLDADDPLLESLYDPSDFELTSELVEAGSLEKGQYFQHGLGEKHLVPAKVLGVTGKGIVFLNLNTGKLGKAGKGKKVRPIKDLTGNGPEPPNAPQSTVTEVPDPAPTVGVGEIVTLGNLQHGYTFSIPDEGDFKVEMIPYSSGPVYVTPLGDPDAPAQQMAVDKNAILLGTPPQTKGYPLKSGQYVNNGEYVWNGMEWGMVMGDPKTAMTKDGISWEVKPHTIYPTSGAGSYPKVPDTPAPGTADIKGPVSPTMEDDAAKLEAIKKLPDLDETGYQQYLSPSGSGGKWKHPQIQTLAEGTIFHGKGSKQLFKVQVAGANPVVTDGVKNYKVNGAWRARLPEGPEADNWLAGDPPLNLPSAEAPAGTEWAAKQALKAKLSSNENGLVIGELPTGAMFTAGWAGTLYQKTEHGADELTDDGEFVTHWYLGDEVYPIQMGIQPKQVSLPIGVSEQSVQTKQQEAVTFEGKDYWIYTMTDEGAVRSDGLKVKPESGWGEGALKAADTSSLESLANQHLLIQSEGHWWKVTSSPGGGYELKGPPGLFKVSTLMDPLQAASHADEFASMMPKPYVSGWGNLQKGEIFMGEDGRSFKLLSKSPEIAHVRRDDGIEFIVVSPNKLGHEPMKLKTSILSDLAEGDYSMMVNGNAYRFKQDGSTLKVTKNTKPFKSLEPYTMTSTLIGMIEAEDAPGTKAVEPEPTSTENLDPDVQSDLAAMVDELSGMGPSSATDAYKVGQTYDDQYGTALKVKNVTADSVTLEGDEFTLTVRDPVPPEDLTVDEAGELPNLGSRVTLSDGVISVAVTHGGPGTIKAIDTQDPDTSQSTSAYMKTSSFVSWLHEMKASKNSTVGTVGVTGVFDSNDGRTYQVVDETPEGITVQVIMGPDDGDKGKKFKLDAGVKLKDVKLPPDTVGALGELKEGDEFENGNGHLFKMVSLTSNGEYAALQDMVSEKVFGASASTNPLDVQPEPPLPALDLDVLKEPDQIGAFGHAKLLEQLKSMGLIPTQWTEVNGYKSQWGPSGKYKYYTAGSREPGDWLRDKDGHLYLILEKGSGPGGSWALMFDQTLGAPVLVTGDTRFRVIENP